jgi:hypothetical protein
LSGLSRANFSANDWTKKIQGGAKASVYTEAILASAMIVSALKKYFLLIYLILKFAITEHINNRITI